ncbi:nuclear factor erythroid 2-related factor 2-like [Aplochiton taeniatus]
MDLVDILWLQDVDMGAGREVFDLQLRQKENDLRRQREEKEKERMRLLKQEEEELLQKLQLDEETGEFLPRPFPITTAATMGTASGGHLDTVFDSSLSFEECMELLAESFPLEEVIQDSETIISPLPASPSTSPAPLAPPAVSPAATVSAPNKSLASPSVSQAEALSGLAPAPALKQPTPVSQNPMLSALLVPHHGGVTLLGSESQSDKDLLCADAQLILPTKDFHVQDAQLNLSNKDFHVQHAQLNLSNKDFPVQDAQLNLSNKDFHVQDAQLSLPTKDLHIQDTHLAVQNKDLAQDSDMFSKDVPMPDASSTPQQNSSPEACNVSSQPAGGSTEEGSYCLMELEDLALFSLEGFDTISSLGGDGDSPDSGLAIEGGFASSSSSSSSGATPNHNEEEGFVGFSESEEEELDVGGIYGQSDGKEVSSSTSLTNQALARDGDLIEGRRHGKRPFTKNKARRSRQTRDEQRARALNIPFPVDRIVNMAVDDFNDLVSRHQLNESQLGLVRDIRRRGKNKVAAQNCRKRKMESISGLEEELQALQEERSHLLEQRTQTQSTVSGLKQQLGSLCLEVFSLVRDETGTPYSPRDYSLQQTSDGTMFMVPRLKKSPKV